MLHSVPRPLCLRAETSRFKPITSPSDRHTAGARSTRTSGPTRTADLEPKLPPSAKWWRAPGRRSHVDPPTSRPMSSTTQRRMYQARGSGPRPKPPKRKAFGHRGPELGSADHEGVWIAKVSAVRPSSETDFLSPLAGSVRYRVRYWFSFVVGHCIPPANWPQARSTSPQLLTPLVW